MLKLGEAREAGRAGRLDREGGLRALGWACRSARQAPPLHSQLWREANEDRATEAERGAVPGVHRRHLPAAKRRRPRRGAARGHAVRPRAGGLAGRRAQRSARRARAERGRSRSWRRPAWSPCIGWTRARPASPQPSCSATTASCTTSATRRRAGSSAADMQLALRDATVRRARRGRTRVLDDGRAGVRGRGAHRRGGRRHDRAEQPEPAGAVPDVATWAGARSTWPPSPCRALNPEHRLRRRLPAVSAASRTCEPLAAGADFVVCTADCAGARDRALGEPRPASSWAYRTPPPANSRRGSGSAPRSCRAAPRASSARRRGAQGLSALRRARGTPQWSTRPWPQPSARRQG